VSANSYQMVKFPVTNKCLTYDDGSLMHDCDDAQTAQYFYIDMLEGKIRTKNNMCLDAYKPPLSFTACRDTEFQKFRFENNQIIFGQGICLDCMNPNYIYPCDYANINQVALIMEITG
jgi:hypothetical protein